MDTHRTGNICEMIVAADCLNRGYSVAFPFGHNTRYDIIVDRNGKLERLQVKGVTPVRGALNLLPRSTGRQNGKRIDKQYDHNEVDWIVAVDTETKLCYYVPIELAKERYQLSLRLVPAKNNQQKKVVNASNFTQF